MADPDRKGGGGLSLRTLAIASAASLTAAMVTSRLFPPGTIYASAMTPVIVAAVSEMLHRPAARVSDLRQQRRTMVLEARQLETARMLGDEPSPLAGAPDFAQGSAADELVTNGSGAHAPVRVHGGRSRILHPRVWLITGLVAFTVAAAALTLPELIFGGAVATKHRTTFFGGGGSSSTQTHTVTTPAATTTQTTPTTVTQTVPAQAPQTTTTQTQTQTTTTDTQTQPQPTTTDTGTSTTPSGAVAPPVP